MASETSHMGINNLIRIMILSPEDSDLYIDSSSKTKAYVFITFRCFTVFKYNYSRRLTTL